jgi:hypothetical protein
MSRLADYAARFERVRKHVSYRVDGRWETLDSDGAPESVKEGEARVETDGAQLRFIVLRYVEDGEDKTDEARKKALESAKRRDQDKKWIKMPLLAGEQTRYVFDQVEIDGRDPTRVRIAFSPRERQDDTIEGSAWVDSQQGTPISAGFRLVRTPLFVEYVNFIVQFGQPTALGPAVSTIGVEGRAGILFFRKRFRASATLGDYHFL